MEKDAIKNDVSEELTRRDQDMEALIKSREAENEEFEIEEEDISDEDEETKEEEEEDTEETTKFRTEDGREFDVPVSAVANLKIDGEEVDSTIDQITRSYQKGASGDKRLEEANTLKHQLALKEEALIRKEQEIAAKMQAVTQDADLSDDDRKSTMSELIEALVEADEDRAAELLPKILPKSDDSNLKVSSLVESAIKKNDLQKEQAVYAIRLQDAKAKFKTDFADLAADDMLYSLVDQETIKVSKANPNATPWDIISEAAQNVRTWKGDVTPQPGKKIKKRTTPTPRGGRASIGSDEAPKETRRDVINEMRVARGQPAL